MVNLHIDFAQSGYNGYTGRVLLYTTSLANPFSVTVSFSTPNVDIIRVITASAATSYGYSSVLVLDSNNNVILVQQLPLIQNSPPPPSSVGECSDSRVLVSGSGLCSDPTPVVKICTELGVLTATCEAGTQPELPVCEGSPVVPVSGVCSDSRPTLTVCNDGSVPTAACLPASQPPPPPAVPPPPPSLATVSGTAVLSDTSVTFAITASGALPDFYNIGFFTKDGAMAKSSQKRVITQDNPQTWVEAISSASLVPFIKSVQVVAGTNTGGFSPPYTIQL